jgi:argininosuccinate lyase
VALAEAKNLPLPGLPSAEVRKVHPGFGADWATAFDLERALQKRRGIGMPGPAQVARQAARWKKRLQG